ncbi:Family S53 protease-like protein [Mycena sanguinolenta]|uniref:Family S53 protease-like protein n=1 Tax=Mycena sanguinolenta TaxID=230812 RepID=A0A8H7D2P8_9AGAR|nr:Family S53 protease-like protein [Mycena sanguinolenta]
MTLCTLAKLLSLAAVVSAGTVVLHESRTGPPTGFVSLGAAPDDQLLTLRVALASNDVTGLESKLNSLSTPGSSNFREWLSNDEIKSHLEPSAATVAAFNTFASANGLNTTVISPHGDWVSITLSVSQANRLFAAQFQRFAHAEFNTTLTRTLSISLPSELVGHVDVIHPTTAFTGIIVGPMLKDASKATTVRRRTLPDSCTTEVSPACLQAMYGIPTTPATQSSNTLMVTGYEGEWAQLTDLAQFLQTYRPDMSPNTTFSLQTVDNGTNPQGPDFAGGEASLDTQYAVGLATDVPVTFLSVGGGAELQDLPTNFLDTITYLEGVSNPPSVVTTSYSENEDNLGISLATKLCQGYMALGARGISIFFSSGDNGVRGSQVTSPFDQTVCANNTFIPTFPNGCPYVTSVGATQLQDSGSEIGFFFSSGGFSNYFPAPPYQTQSGTTAAFLKTIPSDFPGIFNVSGRGFPDVAMNGGGWAIVVNGQDVGILGTSCSTPGFASIIALINDRLVAAGKPVLGFLNPWLYANPQALTDITSGYNPAWHCNDTYSAFNATTGWDPVTGLGTPIFDSLLAAAMA